MTNPCLDELKKSAGTLTRDDLAEIQDEAARLMARKRAGMSDADFIAFVADAADRKMAETQRKKWAKAVSYAKSEETIAFANNVKAARKGKPWIGFTARLVGEAGTAEGLRDSAWNAYRAMQRRFFFEGFRSRLEKDDPALMKLWDSNAIEGDIARAKVMLERGEELVGISPEAAKIAKTMFDVESDVLKAAGERGIYIERNEGYAGHTTYDWMKVRAAGEDAFAEKMAQRFDLANAPDIPYADKLSAAKMLWRKTVSDIYGPPAEYMGRVSAVKAEGARRQWVPKSADDWLAHTQEFGAGSLRETWLMQLDRRSRMISLADKFGPNYKTDLKRQFDEFVTRHISDPMEQRTAMEKGWREVEILAKHVTGEINHPVNGAVARAFANWRSIQRATTLGQSLLAQFSDIPTAASELRYLQFNGKEDVQRGLLSSTGDIMAAMVRNLPSAERKEFGNTLGIFVDNLKRSFSEGDEGVSSAIQKLQDVFFKLNLMHYWTDTLRAALADAIGSMHYTFSAKGFDSLPKGTQIVFANHGISPAMWDVIRQAKHEIGDYKLIAPEKIRDLPDAAFTAYAKAAGDERPLTTIRDDVADRYAQMILDRVAVGSTEITPTARAFLIGDSQAGTFWGDFIRRNVAMLKGFSVQFYQSTVAREIYGYGAHSIMDAIKNGQSGYAFAKLFGMMTVFGYLSVSARDLANGKDMRDPLDARTIGQAMIRGGALGIYGDYLLGNWEKQFGQNIVTYAAGPAFGQISDAADLLGRWTKIYNRSPEDTNWGATLRFARQNTPGLGLLGIKTAFDSLIYYDTMEQINPGYIARAQRNLEKMTGQHYWMLPR